MFVARLGSLNALELLHWQQSKHSVLGAQNISADTMGRATSEIDSESLRDVQQQIYAKLKRQKALETPQHGLIALAIDGHESHSTCKQKCKGCLTRELPTGRQYYHRNVTAQLIFKNCTFLLDAEPQLKGESETGAAKRLFARVVKRFPRAFDVVLCDALYCNEPFIREIVEAGKDIIVVLKDDRRHIFKDAEYAFSVSEPCLKEESGKKRRTCWEHLNALPSINEPIRVIKSVESTTTRCQLSGEEKVAEAEWMWITTLPAIRASTATVVRLGHDRWLIENKGFNEIVTRWHSDHIYKHDPGAILNFLLECMISHNLFVCFFNRNLKPALKAVVTPLHVSKLLTASLYANAQTRHPP